jgi:hypothetical protein
VKNHLQKCGGRTRNNYHASQTHCTTLKHFTEFIEAGSGFSKEHLSGPAILVFGFASLIS